MEYQFQCQDYFVGPSCVAGDTEMLNPKVNNPLKPRHSLYTTDHEPPLAGVLNLLLNRKATIATFVGGALSTGILYLVITPPYYTATAQMLVDTKRSMSVPLSSDYAVDSAVVESQLQTIKSEKIAVDVVQKLDLANDAEFTGPGVLSQILESIGLGEHRKDNGPDAKQQSALATFRRGLGVSRIGLSYAVDISFSSHDPQKAARIANTVADAYINDQLNARTLNTERANSWMLAKIDELRSQASDATDALEGFKAENHVANDDFGKLDEQHEAQFRQLESAAQGFKRSYETFVNLDRFSRTSQEQVFPVTEARILTQASPPRGSSSPKMGLALLVALASGCGLGLLAALAREQLDPTIRSRGQLERRLGVRSLGSIPTVRRRSGILGFQLPMVGSGGLLSFFGRGQDSAEALKTLRRVIAAIDDCNQPSSVLGVTSANSGEGTTTIAFNLAGLAASSGKRVLLIDANFANPSLTNEIELSSQPGSKGLLHRLIGLKQRRQVLPESAEANDSSMPENGAFYFLPHSRNATAMAGTPAKIEEVLIAVRSNYDCVIIDIPSILDHVDVSVMAKLLDFLVIVVCSGDTTLEEAEESIESSLFVAERLLGIIVNKASSQTFPKRRVRARAMPSDFRSPRVNPFRKAE